MKVAMNRILRVIALMIGLGTILTAGGCSRGPGPEVWVIGLDGADWDQLDPMIARGELPHLARLRAEGAWGVLQSDMPMISPLLWTSIATGRTPDEHGVTWFMTDAPDGTKMPISSRERRVRTFWDIASECGVDCGIVGWWATWPADPIAGFLVSDYVGWHSFGVTGRSTADQGKTWPPGLIADVDRLMPAPADIPDELLQRMVHLPAGRLRSDPTAAPYADPPAHLRQAIATSRGYTDLVLDRLAAERPTLLSVYYEGTDAVTHLFGDFQEPRLPWVADEDFAAYRDVLREYWKWQDALVGELLAARGPRTTVIVVSDHGFRVGAERRKEDGFDIATADDDHMPDGIIIVNGPAVPAGTRLDGADIYDVAPTILYALDLAVGADLHGRVLTEAFSPDRIAARPAATVPTWETSPLVRAEDVAADEEAGADMERMLRSLGYVTGRSGGAAGRTAQPEQAVNLATVLMRQGRNEEAVAGLREALAASPGHAEIRQNLAKALAGSGHAAESERIYRELVTEAPERLDYHEDLSVCLSRGGDSAGALAAIEAGLAVDPGWTMGLTRRGAYLFALGRTEEARRSLERAVAGDPRFGRAHYFLGEVLDAAGDTAGAAASLARAHDLEPGDGDIAVGLAGVLERQGRGREALAVLQGTLRKGGEDATVLGAIGANLLQSGRAADAVGPLARSCELAPGSTDVTGNLGMAHALAGDLPAAIRCFEQVVALAPDLADGHAQLGALCAQAGRPDRAVRELETAVALDPGSTDYKLNLGAVYRWAGRRNAAARIYREAIAENPDLAPAFRGLGQIEQDRGHAAESRELLERARALDAVRTTE